jgi:muramidase (phage lysozyme)
MSNYLNNEINEEDLPPLRNTDTSEVMKLIKKYLDGVESEVLDLKRHSIKALDYGNKEVESIIEIIEKELEKLNSNFNKRLKLNYDKLDDDLLSEILNTLKIINSSNDSQDYEKMMNLLENYIVKEKNESGEISETIKFTGKKQVDELSQLRELLLDIKFNTAKVAKTSNADIIRDKREKSDQDKWEKDVLDTLKQIAKLDTDAEVITASGHASQNGNNDWFDTGDSCEENNRRDRKSRRRGRSRGRSRGRTGRLGKLGTIGKAGGIAGAALGAGYGIYEYSQADNTADKKAIIGETVGGIGGGLAGAAAGAAIGSIVPGVGTVVGGIIGSIAGSFAGSKAGSAAGSWFTNPEDSIPDDIKLAGPMNQLNYIDKVLMPTLAEDPQTQPNQLEDLRKYRQKLMTEDLPKELDKKFKDSGGKDGDQLAKINYLSNYYSSLKEENPSLYNDMIGKVSKQYTPFSEDVNLKAPFSGSFIDKMSNIMSGFSNKISNVPGAMANSFTSLFSGSMGAFSGMGGIPYSNNYMNREGSSASGNSGGGKYDNYTIPESGNALQRMGKLIASGEGDYNSVNRGLVNGQNLGSFKTDLSKMTVDQILAANTRKAGDPLRMNAVGKYQIINTTLKEMKKKLKLTGNELFTPELQERIFKDGLLKKQGRGNLTGYLLGKHNNVDLAIYDAAKEWASIEVPPGYPTITGRISQGNTTYYDSNRGNKAKKGSYQAMRNMLIEYRNSADKDGSTTELTKTSGDTNTSNKKDSKVNTKDTPKGVLNQLNDNVKSNKDFYKGKSVFLNSRLENGLDDLATVESQVKFLKDKGATVELRGVDSSKLSKEDAATANSKLEDLAKKYGVKFVAEKQKAMIPYSNLGKNPQNKSLLTPLKLNLMGEDVSINPQKSINPTLTKDEEAKVQNLIKQGMNNPGMISLSTGIPSEKVGKYLLSNSNNQSKMEAIPTRLNSKVEDKKSTNNSNQVASNTTIIQQSSGNSGPVMDPFRISNNTLIFSAMIG